MMVAATKSNTKISAHLAFRARRSDPDDLPDVRDTLGAVALADLEQLQSAHGGVVIAIGNPPLLLNM